MYLRTDPAIDQARIRERQEKELAVVRMNMSDPCVPTRKSPDGQTYYLCTMCGWVKPVEWNGTGFMKYLCPHCDLTLDNDPFDSFAAENDLARSE